LKLQRALIVCASIHKATTTLIQNIPMSKSATEVASEELLLDYTSRY